MFMNSYYYYSRQASWHGTFGHAVLFFNREFFFLKYLSEIYAAAFKACFDQICLSSIEVFSNVRYFLIMLGVLPILLLLLTAYILILYALVAQCKNVG